MTQYGESPAWDQLRLVDFGFCQSSAVGKCQCQPSFVCSCVICFSGSAVRLIAFETALLLHRHSRRKARDQLLGQVSIANGCVLCLWCSRAYAYSTATRQGWWDHEGALINSPAADMWSFGTVVQVCEMRSCSIVHMPAQSQLAASRSCFRHGNGIDASE